MRAVVERFGAEVKAYIVLEGMALGHVYHRGLGVVRYRITARTAGGHSWVDFGQPSAIHELARLVCRLCALPVPAQPRTSLNVGVIAGGTSVNSIASEAWLLLDLRSEESGVLDRLANQVGQLVQAANRPEVRFSKEEVGRRPAGEIPADHPLVRLALSSLEALHIQPRANIGSTDANLPLSRGIAAICLGLTTGGKAHTLEEFIHTQPLAQGLAHVLMVIDSLFDEGAWPPQAR
jgi:acetylornithine deacetylase/succinyl-diaminopimelate desuccinylase-like protein